MENRITYLTERYLKDEATTEEQAEFIGLLNVAEHDDAIKVNLAAGWLNFQTAQEMPADRANLIFQSIFNDAQVLEEEYEEVKVVRMAGWKKIAVAASILLIAGIGVYFLLINKPITQDQIAKTQKERINNDVDPGGYKARLVLADGRIIVLDSANLGELARQGNAVVTNKDGQLVYQSLTSSQESIVYNTVATAKGETYTMRLADGSQIWLNAGSSVRFPVAFPGKERRIEVTGEAYVKVAKNPSQPFIASVQGMDVQALGTEFNINAYPDEGNLSATLVEGSIKVTAVFNSSQREEKPTGLILKPGMQTQLINRELSAAKTVNIQEITAWKDGWFHFRDADLKTILRQFARWYDVDVVYEGPVKNRKFLAIVKRNSTLKTVLEMLQDNNITYRLEGKKLIVKSG